MARRGFATATAALAGAALLLAATEAGAQWRDGRGHDRYGGGGGRDGNGRGAYGQGFRSGGGPSRYAPPAAAPVYAPGYRQDGRGSGYEGGGYGAGRGGWRRGQVLPPGQRDAYVPDPGRLHLRAAPPGYGWVGDGRNAYLTQRSTGMVLDSVPGAYEPAPGPGRGRGRGRGPR